VSFARSGVAGPPAAAGSGFTGLRVALRLAAEPLRRPGALEFEDVELDLELTVVSRPLEPLRFPGGAGAIALAPPALARQRPALRLTRERPAALLGGLRDPFSGTSGEGRGLLVAVSLARASLPAGLDR
jgi:hypothetical protein